MIAEMLKLEPEMKCTCGNNTFWVIENDSCANCAYNIDGESETDGECKLGSNRNNGCDMMICSECKKINFCPIHEDN